MALPAFFSSGMELASCVTSSVLLRKSWDVISCGHEDLIPNEGEGLFWKVYKESDSDLTIIAFESTLDSSNLRADLIPSNALTEKNFHPFKFLCTKRVPLFSVNITAISLFNKNYEKLDQLKSQINNSTSLIVTGYGLGGSVASLFTISMLDNIWLGKNRPLCITFSSPLIGDKKLQEAISHSPIWNSCFLHVVSLKDPLPRLFITSHSSSAVALTPQTSVYMPFGAFFFCSDSNCTCFENPNFVLELLMISINDKNQGFQPIDYGNIVENLYQAICKDFTPQGQDLTHSTNSLRASICLQLWAALGLTPDMQQQQQQDIDINTMVTKMEELEKKFVFQKRRKFDPSKKLNEVKKNMPLLECYKTYSQSRNIGYYDSYKNTSLPWDTHALELNKRLTHYWKNMVEEVKIRPQKASAAFRQSWIHAGTSYRRMVEPLVIAQYYREGGKDYVTKNRPEHFVLLEEWHRKEMTKSNTSNAEGICVRDCSEDWSFYWDWRRNVDKYLPSSQGSVVDEEREDNSVLNKSDYENEEAISSTTGYSSCINQLLLSTNGLNDGENEENLNTSKNNDKINSCYEACVDESLLYSQGSVKAESINKFELNVDKALLSSQETSSVKELEDNLSRTKKKNMQTILTRDSCFWAHVEEALISCNELKVIKEKEETLKKLVEFEEYVYELLKNYEVSSDIFLRESSYMCWWNEYKAIKGTSYDSKLVNFMNDVRRHMQYALGDYDFP